MATTDRDAAPALLLLPDVIRCRFGESMRRIDGLPTCGDVWVCDSCKQVRMESGHAR